MACQGNLILLLIHCLDRLLGLTDGLPGEKHSVFCNILLQTIQILQQYFKLNYLVTLLGMMVSRFTAFLQSPQGTLEIHSLVKMQDVKTATYPFAYFYD